MDMLFDFLYADFLGKAVWAWLLFMGIVAGIMAFDLGLLNRRDKILDIAASLRLSAFYIGLGLLFGLWIWHAYGRDNAVDYYTAFVVEKSLSLDNVFVISIILSYFAVPREYQHRVLFWGILGVLLLRGIVIGFGTVLIQNFDWILYLFAALLIYTGIKILFSSDDEVSLEDNKVIAFLKSHMNITSGYHGNRFFVRLPSPMTGRNILFATPLFLALVTIEIADVLFAFDSVPAVFAITADPYIVFTSNLFAILGLRALFFALEAVVHRFSHMKYALSIVLVFIGAKVFYGHFFHKIDSLMSLGITLTVLAAGVVFSLAKTRSSQPQENKQTE